MPDTAVIQPLNRRQLYDLVWAEPMRDIAERYGISDVGLAKLCRRFDIPTPGMGHWAKVAHGKKVRQVPLPASAITEGVEILSARSREVAQRPPLPDDIAASIDSISRQMFTHPKDPTPHAIVESWTRQAIADERRFNPYRVMAPRIETIEKRRRRFLTLLFREIERREGKISAEDHSKFEATVAGEAVKFSVRERYRQERRPTTDEERRRSYSGNQEYVTETKPTGTLKLELDGWAIRWAKKRFDDKDGLPLEEQLPAILTALYIAAADVRRWRLERDEEERRRWQRQQEEWAAEERRHIEQGKIASLERDVKNWLLADSIRRFIDVVVDSGNGYAGSEEDQAHWVAWANGVANCLDPLATGAGSQT